MQVMSCGCRYDSDVNIADRWNCTPLMAALRNGHLAIAKMLMSCEATLGDSADPALVQVSSILLALPFCIDPSTMPIRCLKCFVDVHSESGNPIHDWQLAAVQTVTRCSTICNSHVALAWCS